MNGEAIMNPSIRPIAEQMGMNGKYTDLMDTRMAMSHPALLNEAVFRPEIHFGSHAQFQVCCWFTPRLHLPFNQEFFSSHYITLLIPTFLNTLKRFIFMLRNFNIQKFDIFKEMVKKILVLFKNLFIFQKALLQTFHTRFFTLK